MSAHGILKRLFTEQAGYDIPDPGDGNSIKVDRQFGVCKLDSAGAETRTLPVPLFPGIHLLVQMMDDDGDITLTVTNGYDQAGNTTITFDTVFDWVAFISVYDKDNDACEWRVLAQDGTDVVEVLAEDVSIADAGSFTSNTTVEAALAEIYQHIASAQAFVPIPMYAWQEADGTALADFVDGASPTPGYADAAEISGIRWNNHANPDPISTSVPYPPDLDASQNVIVHFLAAKIGATLGDAVTWTVTAFENIDGALYDADEDFGGASSAMTGDATSKTVQEETLTLAAANITGSPGAITLTVQPTDGTLGTDDVVLIAVWLEYTRKILTS